MTRSRLVLTTSFLALMLAGCSSVQFGARQVGTPGKSVADATTHYERGKLYFGADQFGMALQSFQLALAERPNSPDTLNAVAATYDRLGRFDLAERYYKRGLGVEPQSEVLLANLAYSYKLRGRNDLAAATFRQMLAVNPASQTARANLAALGPATETASKRMPAPPMRNAAIEFRPAPPSQDGPRLVRLSQSAHMLVTGGGQTVMAQRRAPGQPAVAATRTTGEVLRANNRAKPAAPRPPAAGAAVEDGNLVMGRPDRQN